MPRTRHPKSPTGEQPEPEYVVPFSDGPFIQVACFVDMVLRDDTGTFSLIRMIDSITRTAAGPKPPAQMEPFNHELILAIGLKSGRALGRNELQVIPELPNGETLEAFPVTAHFEGEERGFFATMNINMTFQLEGLYWFNVFLESHKLTSIPLRIKYDRQFRSQPPVRS
jgi:hypothetical protein